LVGGYGSVVAEGRASDQISPTAHYTGYVWARAGLSHPAFVTNEGRLLYAALIPLNAASALTGGPTLEGFLLARHLLIDHLLEAAIDEGRISQVIEIAAGLSPRGWSFAGTYGDRISYVETDLPGMAARKRAILTEIDSLNDHHRVVELNALADHGPDSLAALAATLDPARGTAIITEGLINYFDRDTVVGMWRRFAQVLGGFSAGTYLSDLHLQDANTPRLAIFFTAGLSAFVRGRVHMHFEDASEAVATLRDCGFAAAALHRPSDFPDVIGARARSGADVVRVIETDPKTG
jgi:O-methyltransferase involved in polyketide biosynthesis